MQLLAPDPRLGVAPERVARVRALLGVVTESAGGDDAVPGVGVALPGGAGGVLDALILRPDRVVGLVPAAVRESVGARSGAPGGLFTGGPDSADTPVGTRFDAPAADVPASDVPGPDVPVSDAAAPDAPAADPVDTAAADAHREIDRLLGLPDPPCPAPRRLLCSLPSSTRDDAASLDGSADGPARTGHTVDDASVRALAEPVSGARTMTVGDVRRLLEAFRLRAHVPGEDDLLALGFAPDDPHTSLPSHPGAGGWSQHPSLPDAPVIPHARRPPPADGGIEPAPVTAPMPVATPEPRRAPPGGGRTPTAPAGRSTPGSGSAGVPGSTGAPGSIGGPVPGRTSRAGDPRPALPTTGRSPAASSSASTGSGTRRRSGGRSRIAGAWSLPRQQSAWARTAGERLAPWLTGYRGLAVAAAGAFLAALGLALLIGRVTGVDEVAAAPAPTVRVVDGVAFTRAVTATDLTCEGRAHGQAAQFLTERPCEQLDRALWTGTVDGRSVVVSVATVRMGDTVSASALKSLVDTPGTGNVSDLLREGRGYPGAPDRLTGAGYASALLGDGVVFAQADRVEGAAMTAEDLAALSRTGLGLG